MPMTEPDTGSDLQAVRTTARREGDHYVINGSKTFISNATHADLMVIVAKTDTSQGARGISLFLAEISDDTPGSDLSTWYAVDREVYIALTLPGVSGSGPIQKLSTTIEDTLEAREIDPAPYEPPTGG